MRNSSGINEAPHPLPPRDNTSPLPHTRSRGSLRVIPFRTGKSQCIRSHSQLFLKRFRHRYIIRRHRGPRSGRRHGNGMIEMTRNLAGQTRYVVGIPAPRSQRSRRRVLRKRRSRPPGTPLNAAHGSRLDFGIGRIVQISGNFMNLDRLHSFRIIQAGRQVVREVPKGLPGQPERADIPIGYPPLLNHSVQFCSRSLGPKPWGSSSDSGNLTNSWSPRATKTVRSGANSYNICRQAPQGQQ